MLIVFICFDIFGMPLTEAMLRNKKEHFPIGLLRVTDSKNVSVFFKDN